MSEQDWQNRIDPQILQTLIKYEPETGALTWKARGIDWFKQSVRKQETMCKIWNAKHAGKRCLNSLHDKGYLSGAVLNQRQLAHRVAFAIANGRWPDGQIDHINGIKTDNRISNLRDVDAFENGMNMPISSANKSGRIGVHVRSKSGKWVASIKVQGKCIFLGEYELFDDAVCARVAAEQKYGFHKNHGRAAL